MFMGSVGSDENIFYTKPNYSDSKNFQFFFIFLFIFYFLFFIVPQGAVWGENLMYGSVIRTVMLLPTMII